MNKQGDIETLFSLLDKKPSGTYQEIVVEEQIQESKKRWPIFGLSDVADHLAHQTSLEQTEKQQEEAVLGVVSKPKPSFAIFSQTEKSDLKSLLPQQKNEAGLFGWSQKLQVAVEEEDPSKQTALESLFTKLQQKVPAEKSLFEKLVKK